MKSNLELEARLREQRSQRCSEVRERPDTSAEPMLEPIGTQYLEPITLRVEKI
jgi:hypothetical protein